MDISLKIVETVISDTHITVTLSDALLLDVAKARVVVHWPLASNPRGLKLVAIQAEALRSALTAIDAEIERF